MLKVTWIDAGKEPQVKSNPQFPRGADLDTAGKAKRTCNTALQYPAPRCGYHLVECSRCGLKVGVTTAGRPDDPRSIRVACKTVIEKGS
jgi:hypothetical protein